MAHSQSVMSQIQCIEDALQDSLHRIGVIERKLKTNLFSLEAREKLETELEEVKEVLHRNEEKLQTLRKSNTQTFMVAAALFFACFLIYGLYSFFRNLNVD